MPKTDSALGEWDLIWIIQRQYYKSRQPLCYILAIAAMNNDVKPHVFLVVTGLETIAVVNINLTVYNATFSALTLLVGHQTVNRASGL